MEIQTVSHCMKLGPQWGKPSVRRVNSKVKDILHIRAVKNLALLKLGAELEEGSVGKQNLPPQDVSLWHKDYLIFNKRLGKNL